MARAAARAAPFDRPRPIRDNPGGCEQSRARPQHDGPTALNAKLPRLPAGLFRTALVLILAGLGAAGAAADVVTIEIDTGGRDLFRIETPSATYVFDKKAAALVELYDRDGHDWISFRPEGTPGIERGGDGWFRGLPQLGSSEFGHTRRERSVSTTPDPLGVPLPKATIEATADGWRATWEFFPSHARMTLHEAPETYWLLYEGTPGGVLGSDDRCWRSDGRGQSCAAPWGGDVVNTSGAAPDAEWVYFADGTLDRSFFLAHKDDDVIDSYFRKDGMTVFGFGREPNAPIRKLTNLLATGRHFEPQLDRTPAVLVFGFVEARGFETVKREIDRLYRFEPRAEDPSPHPLPVVTEVQEPPA